MNALPSPLLLIGIGGAGAWMTRGILRAYGSGIRALVLDTDAQSGATGDLPFMLLGGNRLAGRGTGGQPASARAAFQDNPALIDPALEGVRTAVLVTALGGGTGSGATGELLKHLHTLGIVTLLFATTPFSFEGEDRIRSAKTAAGPIGEYADVSVFLPLDALVAAADTHEQEACAGHALFELGDGLFHGCAVVVVVAAVGSGNVQAIYENHQVVVPCAVETANHIIVHIAQISSRRASQREIVERDAGSILHGGAIEDGPAGAV